MGLAQSLSSHSLVTKNDNCLKYDLIDLVIDSFIVQTSVEQILHAFYMPIPEWGNTHEGDMGSAHKSWRGTVQKHLGKLE